MPPTVPIQTPEPEADRPRAWTVAAVGVAGLVLGILLVRSTLDEPRRPSGSPPPVASDVERPTPAEADAPAEPPSEAPVAEIAHAVDASVPVREAVAPTDAATAAAVAEPPPEPPEEAVSTAASTGDSTNEGATDRVVRLGRIAYLRCDGAETGEGPYPCPRDRDLERAALAAIEALPSCPNAPPGIGEADVRIHYVAGGPNEILLREGSSEGQLDGPSVLACLREPLSQLTTDIQADPLVVSFRFELVSAP